MGSKKFRKRWDPFTPEELYDVDFLLRAIRENRPVDLPSWFDPDDFKEEWMDAMQSIFEDPYDLLMHGFEGWDSRSELEIWVDLILNDIRPEPKAGG